jgi:hypothetical protein
MIEDTGPGVNKASAKFIEKIAKLLRGQEGLWKAKALV